MLNYLFNAAVGTFISLVFIKLVSIGVALGIRKAKEAEERDKLC